MIRKFEVHVCSQPSKLPTMRRPDNPEPRRSRSFLQQPAIALVSWGCPLILFACGLVGCNRFGDSRYAQLMQDADNKSAQGDFERAVNLYEAALDDSPRGADVHYKLALLYDDKLNDPVSALHHFKRYLALAPNGSHAKDVKDSIKRDEIAALTALSSDSVITRAEASRLRNENLTLHKKLEDREASRTALEKLEASNARKPGLKNGGQTYVVQSGDTLVSISRKFYKSPKRWEAILEANKQSIRNPKDLTVGQTIIIP
jgi:tetratricopeptide (TPR) repeat protein